MNETCVCVCVCVCGQTIVETSTYYGKKTTNDPV